MLPAVLKMSSIFVRFHVAVQALLFAISGPNRPVCVLRPRYTADLWIGEQSIDKAAMTLTRPHALLGTSRIFVRPTFVTGAEIRGMNYRVQGVVYRSFDG